MAVQKKEKSIFQTLSPRTREKLSCLGLSTPKEIVFHLPIRYHNQTKRTPVRSITLNQPCLVEGTVWSIEKRQKGIRKKQLFIALKDDFGDFFFIRFLHSFPSQEKTFSKNQRIRCFGEFKINQQGHKETVHPEYAAVEMNTPLPDHLTALYPTTAGLSQKTIRKIIHSVLPNEPWLDILPKDILERHQLLSLKESLMGLHYPPPSCENSMDELANRTHIYWKRLKFDELLAHYLALDLIKEEKNKEHKSPTLMLKKNLVNQFLADLPFTLTEEQEKAWQDIQHDLCHPGNMYRLLQGEVGSGKTVVALLAALMAIDNGYQVALMAPTEILAEQHYIKISSWFQKLGLSLALLHASLPQKSKRLVLDKLSEGHISFVIGTHSLFQKEVTFHQLALVITDEQHRFGVSQRLSFWKKGLCAHQLMMSATPIPRTLAMTYAGYLPISTIEQRPQGRQPIETHLFQLSKKETVLEKIKTHIDSGEQVYWVCPLIEDSEKVDLTSVLETYALITKGLPHSSVGLLHGRMKSHDKSDIMNQFLAGSIQVLVTTTVIEVGIDVAQATLIVIEHAERFGLAQLHQLRGRVGRGNKKSYCLLLYHPDLSEAGKKRLRALYDTQDGFLLAEKDLEIRGAGQLFGENQSGMHTLRFSDMMKDATIAEEARLCAAQLMKDHQDIAVRHHQFWLSETTCYINA